MRTILTSARIAVISLLLATGLLAPVTMTRAAAPASAAHQPTITGTVVATPQHQLPATLLLQVGGQTLAVSITPSTELSRRFGGDSHLDEFTDGDTVDVIGEPNESGGITARHIINQSVQERFTELHGTVASINPPGIVPTTIVLTGLSTSSANAPYPNPLPAQMSLPVTGATTIDVGGVSQPASLAIGKINVNDHVSAIGVYDRFTNSFDSIEAITVAAPPPPVTLQIKGTLAAVPSQLAAPVTLCLQNASVTASAIRPNLTLTSPCPAGQVPVYATSATKFLRMLNEGSSLVELSAGDTLWVTGSLIDTQLMAQTVEDRSIHLPSVSGPVQSITANGNITDIVITVTKYVGASPNIPIGSQVMLPLTNSSSPNCVTPSPLMFPCTVVSTGAGTTNGYTPSELSVGQTLTATGVHNFQLQRFLDITKVVAATPPPPPPSTLTIKGTLASAPSQANPPTTLCLRNASVTSNALRPNVSVVSPCPAGQIPVAVTSATRIVRGDSGAANLGELNAGDSLQATGSLINTVFTATLIRDSSIRVGLTTVVGTVGYVSPFTHPGYFTVRVLTGVGRHSPFHRGMVVVVYVGPNTTIVTSAGTTNAITALSPGQAVIVVGVYNRKHHAFTFTDRVRVL